MKLNQGQDVFVIPDGAPGALAELERRKFTAEEGVCIAYSFVSLFTNTELGSPYSIEWSAKFYLSTSTVLTSGSIQCLHKIWAIVRLVQSTCLVFPCNVKGCLHSGTTEKIHATIQLTLGKLSRRC